MKPMVEVKNLKKYYGKGENLVKAVDHTNLVIEKGKFTAIVGRSGSGKSTLLHLIGGWTDQMREQYLLTVRIFFN